MRRRDVLKAIGFSGSVLGLGGVIGMEAASEEHSCYENLEEDKFYELLGTHEDEPGYLEEYDLNDNGAIDEMDLQTYNQSQNGPMCF